MSLVAGSYNRFIWGYRLRHLKTAAAAADADNDEQISTLTLAPQFSYAAHLSPINSIAVSGSVAASSANDDTVKLYDLSTSTELGSVLLHTAAAATCLTFFSPSSFPTNLLAGAANGTVQIFDVNPFLLLKSCNVHKKSVNDIAVHPSGRLALTVARDSCLAMVNLVRGKRGYCSRLEKEAEVVKYFGDGTKFFMCCGDDVTVHSAENAKLLSGFRAAKRILCATPGENGLIITGGEDCGVTAWDSVSGKVAYSIEDAHKNRVKGIVVLSKEGNSGGVENPFLVASASSDGLIRVWDVRATTKGKTVPLSEADTKSRLNCLAGTSIKSFKQLQTKKDAPENNTAETED